MQQLKLTDLMVRDWVNYTGKDFNEFTDRISGITGGCVTLEKEMIHRNMADIRPIPLTSEILERNGFTHWLTAPCGYYHAPAYEMSHILFHISEDTYEDTYHTVVFTDHNDNNFVLFKLCYVHELQHILRLCGLNDLADNLKLEE